MIPTMRSHRLVSQGSVAVLVLAALVGALTGCKSAAPPETPGEAEALVPLDPVMARLEHAVDAMGGAEVVDAVTSLELDGQATRWLPSGLETTGRLRTMIAFPDRYRQEVEGQVGPIATILRPDGAFLAAVNSLVPLTEEQAIWMHQSLARNPVRLLQARHRDDLDATVEPVGDTEMIALTLEGIRLRVGFDPDSGAISRIVVPDAKVPEGGSGELDSTFGDYREVGGLHYPFTSQGTFQGRPVFRTNLDAVIVNPSIDPEIFTSPSPILRDNVSPAPTPTANPSS